MSQTSGKNIDIAGFDALKKCWKVRRLLPGIQFQCKRGLTVVRVYYYLMEMVCDNGGRG